MNNSESNEAVIGIEDIIYFIGRQYRTIILVFVACTIISAIFIFTRPDIYKSSIDIMIGTKNYFTGSINSYSIETPEQIKYIHSNSNIEITPIKNTSIIRVTATTNDASQSKFLATNTAEKIVNLHNIMLDEFLSGLSNNKDLKKSATTSPSRIIGDIQNSIIAFGQPIERRLLFALICSALVALIYAILKDILKRYMSTNQKTTDSHS